MKYNTCVVFGGQSVEHEVSIITASQLMENINKEIYEVIPIYLTKSNEFFSTNEMKDIQFFKTEDLNQIKSKATKVEFIKHGDTVRLYAVNKNRLKALFTVDLVILSVHGTNCEDGTLSAYFDHLNLPYVGSPMLSSSISQNKAMTKILLEKHDIPVIPYTYFYKNDYLHHQALVIEACESLTYPLIIKPATLGSSVGVELAHNQKELIEAIEQAQHYDECILVEKAITDMKEYNCAILGNRNGTKASLVEEVLKEDKILSYKDKYLSGSKSSKGMASTKRKIPAEIDEVLEHKIKQMAQETFKVLGNSGISRIDFIYDQETAILYVNELNTIPGSFSYYLWDKHELSYPELINELVKLAFDDYKSKENKTFTYDTNILSMASHQLNKLK